jgi:hypothetical protein
MHHTWIDTIPREGHYSYACQAACTCGWRGEEYDHWESAVLEHDLHDALHQIEGRLVDNLNNCQNATIVETQPFTHDLHRRHC